MKRGKTFWVFGAVLWSAAAVLGQVPGPIAASIENVTPMTDLQTIPTVAMPSGLSPGNGPRSCTGTPGYENMDSAGVYFAPGMDVALEDDIYLATGACEITCYQLLTYGPDSYDVNAALFTDCTGNPGSVVIDGTQAAWAVPAGSGLMTLEYSLPVPTVVPGRIWLVVSFSDGQAGWVLAGDAPVGFTEDRFGAGSSCDLWLNSDPYAGFGAALYGNCGPCDVACPPGGVQENEPPCEDGHNDAFNGGCSSSPAAFSPIACGQTVCGQAGTFRQNPDGTGQHFRDTDWYQLNTTEPRAFVWEVTAEFPVELFVLDGRCGCGDFAVVAGTYGAACAPASLTTDCLPPGTYWFFVAAAGFTGVPCGRDYTATLTCSSCAFAPGEGCWNAEPIVSLPFNAGGTTCGFTDNYVATCPYTSTGADVVYAYTPAADQHITIDLCGSLFDTQLYVFEDACASCGAAEPLACSDDACGADGLQSRIECLSVAAGHTYYLVIDGFDAGCGDYELAVSSPPPEIIWCPLMRTVPADAGCQAAMPDLTDEVLAMDTCEVVSITQSPGPGTMVGSGVIPVEITVTDNDGLADSCVTAVSVVDQTAPTPVCPGNIAVSTDPGQCSAIVSWTPTVTDNCPGATITCSPPSGSAFPVGTTSVTCTATDAAGNTAQCTFTVSVSDAEQPVPHCPGNIAQNAPPGACGTAVTWEATVSDNCPGATIICTPPSGSAFSVGTTQVTCTATDAALNTAQCSFTVTIVDAEAPVAQCPPDITQDAAAGMCSAVVTWEARVTDNCPGATITCDPPSGSTFPVGTALVACTATDAAGNMTECSFGVTVRDAQPPAAHCPADISQGSDPGICGAVVTWAATVTDNCPGAMVSCDHASGSVFPVGVTPVTCTATDAAGATGQCTFTVTVTDQEAPAISSCPLDRILDADVLDEATIPDLTGEVAASDNCGGLPAVVQDPPGGTVVGPGETVVTMFVTDAANNTHTCEVTITVVAQRIALVPDSECYGAEATVTVEVWMENVVAPIVGGQFFLQYEPEKLELLSVSPSAVPLEPFDENDPFDTEIYECSTVAGASLPQCRQIPGLIDYAVGTRDQSPPYAGATGTKRMAILEFRALTTLCDEPELVTFRPHAPPMRLSDYWGDSVEPLTVNAGIGDGVAPEITCPGDVIIECSESTLPAHTGLATAADDCDPAPGVNHADDTSGLTGCEGTGTLIRTWTAADLCGNAASCGQTITIVDDVPPVITCPVGISVKADAGSCSASVDVGMATATDNCDQDVGVGGIRDDGLALTDPYPVGTTLITWTATDACGLTDTCEQTISVNNVSELVLEAWMRGNNFSVPFTRCIVLELYDCTTLTWETVSEVIWYDTFVEGVGARAYVIIDVPCGSYTCVRARDPGHTLWATDEDFHIADRRFAARFTNKTGGGGEDDRLINGDLNGDGRIEVLDFALYVAHIYHHYVDGNTRCDTPDILADFTGDAVVDSLDFTFIQTYYLRRSDGNCCGLKSLDDDVLRTEIPVAELIRLGLGELTVADLNGDGMVDSADIMAFMDGVMPEPPAKALPSALPTGSQAQPHTDSATRPTVPRGAPSAIRPR